MFCLIEIRNGKEMSRRPMSEECYQTVLDGLNATRQLRAVDQYFRCFHEALKEFEDWCITAPQGSEYIERNRHTAERLCRGVLFEFKAFLDHTEKLLKKTYGKTSEAVLIFKKGTHNAYDTCAEYAFMYHLRNSMQHFNSIVHSFVSPNKRSFLQPCSNPSLLLQDSGWKDEVRCYIQSTIGNIDLYDVFVKTYDALELVFVPVMNFLLANKEGGTNIIMLRNWIEPLFVREESHFYHLFDDVDNTAVPVYWESIYRIADSLDH